MSEQTNPEQSDSYGVALASTECHWALEIAARALLDEVDAPGWGTFFQPAREHLRAALDRREISDEEAWDRARSRSS